MGWYEIKLEENLKDLADRIKSHKYRPQQSINGAIPGSIYLTNDLPIKYQIGYKKE